MNLINKCAKTLLLCVLMLLFTGSIFAATPEEKQEIDSIKPIVEEFLKINAPGLDADKEHYGLSNPESFSSYSLSGGIPYYFISQNIKNATSLSKDNFVLGGYYFPIRVNDKPAGVADVRFRNGKWAVYAVFSDLSLEQDVTDAKKTLTEGLSTILVDDQGLGVRALIFQGKSGLDMIPFNDNKDIGLTKNERVSIESKADGIRNAVNKQIEWTKANPLAVGGVNLAGDVQNNPLQNQHRYYLGVGFILVVLVFSGMAIKRRKTVEGQ